ncbi:lipopolysaccharide assembly protein LapA domain-containing protein [Devosia sp.]|uniref:lipopolysaccharide assembly protein LapA domain-containing protein n=1 Tax=Devosia sp. TaxID=1871048 RepID=UPI002F022396
MIRRIVGWFVLVPLCVVLIVFALANRQTVEVNFNPFATPAEAGAQALGVPLFLVIFAVLLVGVLLGGVATWFAQGPHRRDEKHFRRETERLYRELDAARRAPANTVLLEADDFANQ